MVVKGKFLVRNFHTVENRKDGKPLTNPFVSYSLSEVGGTGGDLALNVNGQFEGVTNGSIITLEAEVRPTMKGFNQSLWFDKGSVKVV